MKPTYKITWTVLSALLIVFLSSNAAVAVTAPRNGNADARVKTLTYRENDVYQLKGHYGFTTMIELSPKENIETTSIGDSEAWQVIPSSHRSNILFVKPLEPNAETNMTVLTDKRVYAFELSASVAASYKSDELAFRLRFIYPEDAKDTAQGKKPREYNPLSDPDSADWNFNYAYAGAKRLRPERAFDDGTFTYLEFDSGDITPAVFVVDEKGKESLVNFNVNGRYLVIERIGKQFTLRDGDTATCIFNESYSEETGNQAKKTAITGSDKKKQPIPSKKPEASPESVSENVSIWESLGTRDVNSSISGFNQ